MRAPVPRIPLVRSRARLGRRRSGAAELLALTVLAVVVGFALGRALGQLSMGSAFASPPRVSVPGGR